MRPINSSRTIHFHCSFSFTHTTNLLVMNIWSMNRPSGTSECMLCSLFSFVSYTYAYLLHMCSLYRGFLCWRDQKERSLFIVGRCSLYRSSFTAKIDRGDRHTRSYRRCSLIEVLLYLNCLILSDKSLLEHVKQLKWYYVTIILFKHHHKHQH
jgi:hypothetical protein